MTTLVLAAVLAALAAHLLLDHPAARLGRLRERPLARTMPRAGVGLPVRHRVVGGLVASLASLVLLPGGAGLVGAALLGPAAFLALGRIRRGRDTARAAAQLPQALDFIAVCLDAGLPLPSALDAVARVSPTPTSDVMEKVASQLAIGRGGQEAWLQLRADPVWGRVASDIARAEHSGTALADLLRVHAGEAREEVGDAALKSARKVGVKSVVPLMACFLPAFLLVGVVPIVAGLLKDFFG